MKIKQEKTKNLKIEESITKVKFEAYLEGGDAKIELIFDVSSQKLSMDVDRYRNALSKASINEIMLLGESLKSISELCKKYPVIKK